MLREMSMRQFMTWWDFDQVEPIGGIRGDWQAASICAALYNVFRSRSVKPANVEDFLLTYGKRKKQEAAKDGGSKAPSAAAQAPWQHMKFIARMQVALSKAEEARPKKKKSKRG